MSAAGPPLAADVQLDERQMYVVEWADGAVFGFTVAPVQSDRGPVLCLARRTAADASVGLQDVVPGDLLVAIGPDKVYHMGATQATNRLRAVPKPVRLTLQLSPFGADASAAAAPLTELPPLAPHECTYVWTSGPLGIVLTTDAVSKLPRVKRFTGKADSVALAREVQVGDELIYVNQTPTRAHSIAAIIHLIREMPKPITLRFRKNPLPEAHETALPEGDYDFLWEFGSLGLVVGTSADGLPYVRSFTGKGTSKQLAQVRENDEIVMVNDRLASELGFHETMQYIMNVPKPALIRFRRPAANQRKTGMLDQSAKSTMSLLTAQTAAMGVNGEPPHLQRTSSVGPSACAAGSPPATTLVRSQSSSHCSLAADETDASPGILAYRSTRSNSSLPIVRRQNVAKHQGQPSQAGQGVEDLTFGQMASAQGYGDTGYRHQQPPPPHEPYHEQVPLQQQQSFYRSSQEGQQQARNGSLGEDGDFYEIDSDAYYQIQWTDGPFGFTVREAQSEQGSVVLITKRTGKSTCAGLRRVAVGDILIKIGNKDVRQLGFERSTMHLRNVPKPVLLTFQAID
ncbi:unnamed protein product [Hyaloperonospora brassicae]|uniref:PDZ domain-containing protein n=1 Tax=Hyaloperonospora brassicae TaxID=162125 RepID=A0AAV0UE66_HYABA|nr:unnamed protein product [Hyaloperonospora brassicae]